MTGLLVVLGVAGGLWVGLWLSRFDFGFWFWGVVRFVFDCALSRGDGWLIWFVCCFAIGLGGLPSRCFGYCV